MDTMMAIFSAGESVFIQRTLLSVSGLGMVAGGIIMYFGEVSSSTKTQQFSSELL